MYIYLARHGQTTGDIENLYGGDYDDDLTAVGRSQAQKLAADLKPAKPEAIFTSPKRRAQQTAQIIGQVLGLEVTMLEELRERNNYGILTGMERTLAKQQYPDQVALLEDFHNTLQGGEPYDHFRRRVLGAFQQLLKQAVSYQSIAIVSHAGPISVIFRELLGAESVAVADCGYAILQFVDQQLSVIETVGIETASGS